MLGERSRFSLTTPKVKMCGKKVPYLIKRYTDDVKTDDFRFISDKTVTFVYLEK